MEESVSYAVLIKVILLLNMITPKLQLALEVINY